MASDPLCVQCLQRGVVEPTTDVDHIVPHGGDADLFWDPLNLQGLCHSCHSTKTQGER
jgi:5-methylcytosine-specific restriction protein A